MFSIYFTLLQATKLSILRSLNIDNYSEDLNEFFKLYNYLIKEKKYFHKLFNKFSKLNLGYSKFLYLYIIYITAVEKKSIKQGDLCSFFYLCYTLNMGRYVLKFRPVEFFDCYYASLKLQIIDFSDNDKKRAEQLRYFNLKFKKMRAKSYFTFAKIISLYMCKTRKKLKWSYIKYSVSSLAKYITPVSDYTLYFLRKNKSFNKGRYSRNRQNYRSGVYWCLYINVIALFSLYFLFYRFSFNLGYLWWLFYCLPASFIFPYAIRNKLYSPQGFYNSVYEFMHFILYTIHIIFFNKW